MTEAIALNALNVVECLAEKLGAAEGLLERGYAEFADALLTVQENRYWQSDHESWGAYMKYITDKFNMGQRQVYHKLAAVKELKGVVDLEDMTEMGITKASALADAYRMGWNPKEYDGVALALQSSTTVKQLKQALAESLHLPAAEDSNWVDFEFAFYATSEEAAEIRDAISAARQMDPPISNTLTDFMQRKEVLLRFAREFLASYPSEKVK